MTTSRSPLRVLKLQANRAAALLKAIDRGEQVPDDPGGRIAASRAKGVVKFAVLMDDKSLVIEMSWPTISATSEAGLSEFILKNMRDSRETEH